MLKARVANLKKDLIAGLGKRIPFGIEEIDNFWIGIPRGKITVISGEHNTGKTLLLHQLAVINFLRNNSPTAFFNCDNSLKFDKSTLEKIISRYSSATSPDLLRNLYYIKITTFDHLKSVFNEKIEFLIDHDVSLILIDSMINCLNTKIQENNIILANFLKKTKQIIEKYDIALVITNSAYHDPKKNKIVVNAYNVFKGLSYYMIFIEKIKDAQKRKLRLSFLESNEKYAHYNLEAKDDGLHFRSNQ